MATKKLNKNLVVALTLTMFAAIIVLSVIMLNSLARRDPKHFVELADQFAAEEQWQQAARFYHEAWRRSDDAAYLVRTGEMLMQEGEVLQALTSWRQALVLRPDLIDAHVQLTTFLLDTARLYGTAREWEQVKEAAEAFLGLETEVADAGRALAHNALGLALVNLASRDETYADRGRAELETAAQLAPDQVDYTIDLANHYARSQRDEEAEALHLGLLEQHPSAGADASKVRLAYAGFLSGRGRADEAEETYRQSLDLAANDPDALAEAQLGYAVFLSRKWDRARRNDATRESAQAFFDEAEAILKRGIDAEPDGFKPHLQLALLYKVAGRHQDVVDVCEQRLQRGLSRKGIEASRNRVRTFTLMIYASQACVALALEADKADDMEAAQDYLAKAEQYVLDAKGESPSHPRVLSQSGRVKLARRQERAALEDLRAADEAYRSFGTINWENTMILANAHLRLNEAGAAKALLTEVLDEAARLRSTDTTFWNLYAQSLLQTDELERALAVVDRILLVNPKNAEATLIKAAIYERQNKPEQAGAIHEQLTGSPTVRAMLTARAKAIDGDVDGALEVLREALQSDPADARLVGMTVNELLNIGRPEEAQAIVAKALELKPDDVSLQQLAVYSRPDLTDEQRDQAMLEAIELEKDAFKRALDLVVFHSRRSDFAKTLIHVDDALSHLRARDTPLARTATTAQHYALLKTKLRIAGQLENEQAQEDARKEAADYNVDGAGGKSILGLYHMQRREYDLAINALREAVETQPSDASALTLLGRCLQIVDRVDEAQTSYERAVRANRDEGFAHQGLAFIALARGDSEAYERELENCERLIPNDPWVRERVLLRTEAADPQAAIGRREAILAESPNDTVNLGRLAALYETVGNREKADEQHETLRRLLPEEERVVVGAAHYYRRTERGDRAIQLLRDYAESRPTPEEQANTMRIVAREHVKQGDTAKAESVLLASADLASTLEVERALVDLYLRVIGEPVKALPWIDRAVEHARDSAARQVPALLEARIACRLHRAVNDLDGARRDISELTGSFAAYARGFLWEAEIHAREGEIDEAISSLSTYLADRPDDTYALYQRARHRVARGSTAAAIGDLTAIKRISPLALRLEPRILLARLQRRAGRDDLWVRELESIIREAPNSAGSIEELVDAYILLQRLDDADRIVTAQINRRSPRPDGRWFFLRGRISLEHGKQDEALGDYRRGAELSGYSASSIARVLGLYTRLERFADGVEYFESLPEHAARSATTTSRYARLAAAAGQQDRAVAEFRKAMTLAMSDAPETIPQVIGDLQAAFEADEAIPLFEDEPADESARRPNQRILVRLYASAARYDDAVARLDALIADAAGDAERGTLLHEKGDIEQLADRTDEAVAAYEQALALRGESWVTLNNVAYVLSDKKGDNSLALPYAKRAASLAENSFTLDTLGWIYVGLGQYQEAIAELSHAIRRDPDYAWAYYHLGEAYRRGGQFNEAVGILDGGLDIARNAADSELVGLFEASTEKARNRDDTP